VIGEIKKPTEVGLMLRKISLEVARRKEEVECSFLLHGMSSIKLLIHLEL
jgi:hypothetical protein